MEDNQSLVNKVRNIIAILLNSSFIGSDSLLQIFSRSKEEGIIKILWKKRCQK